MTESLGGDSGRDNGFQVCIGPVMKEALIRKDENRSDCLVSRHGPAPSGGRADQRREMTGLQPLAGEEETKRR